MFSEKIKETKLSCCIYEETSSKEAGELLGWVTLQLVDHMNLLKTGPQHLGLWMNNQCNIAHSCVSNDNASYTLILELYRFKSPVLFLPPIPTGAPPSPFFLSPPSFPLPPPLLPLTSLFLLPPFPSSFPLFPLFRSLATTDTKRLLGTWDASMTEVPGAEDASIIDIAFRKGFFAILFPFTHFLPLN